MDSHVNQPHPAVQQVVWEEMPHCQTCDLEFLFLNDAVKQSLLKDAKEQHLMRRRVVIILSVVVGIAATLTVAHRLVPTILRSERHALLSGHIMLITMKNRDTSNLISFPVDYRREGNSVYVGSDSAWWKHLEGGAEVRMLIKGTEVRWLGDSYY